MRRRPRLAGILGGTLLVALTVAGAGAADDSAVPLAGTIVYRCGSFQSDLCRIRGDVGRPVRLTHDGNAQTPYSSPSLSRDGRVLAYVHDRRVFLAAPDLSRRQQLFAGSTRVGAEIDRRGERTLVLLGVAEQKSIGPPTAGFTGVVLERGKLTRRPMFVVGADLEANRIVGISARDQRLVLSLPVRGCCGRAIVRSEYALAQPALAPDAQRLAVTVDTGSGTRLGVLTLGSGRLALLADLARDTSIRGVTWSPDGRSLLFAAAVGDSTPPRLFLAPARAGGRATPLGVAGDSPTWGSSPPDA